MEAAERKLALLGGNPPPPPPPPSRGGSKRSSGPQPTVKTQGSSDRVWRRRPDDEVPQIHRQQGNPTVGSRQTEERPAAVASPTGAAVPSEGAQHPNSASNYLSHAALSSGTASPDIEQTSTTSGGTSWSLRVPWLKRKGGGSRYDVDATGTDDVGSALSFGESETTYYRDVMNAYDFMNMHEIVGHDSDRPEGVPPTDATTGKLQARGSESGMSISSQVTSSRSSASASTGSLANFKESEWTPQDSSYGAACPVCGFVPKRIRRLVEFTIIGLVILSLVYLVVTTSIRITNDHMSHSGSNSDADVDLDDDFYIEWSSYADDDVVADDVYADSEADAYDNQEEDEYDEEGYGYGDDDNGDGGRYLRRALYKQGLWLAQ